MRKILILEDMEDRITAFRAAAAKSPDVELVLWRNAADMIRDLQEQEKKIVAGLSKLLAMVEGAE